MASLIASNFDREIFDKGPAGSFKIHTSFDGSTTSSMLSESTTNLVGPDFFESFTQNSTVFSIEDQSCGLSVTAGNMVEELKSYFGLGENWNGEDAKPPDKDTIIRAISFVKKADIDNLMLHFVAPGPEGEILIELKREDAEAEVYFETEWTTYAHIYNGDKCIDEGELDEIYPDLKDHLFFS